MRSRDDKIKHAVDRAVKEGAVVLITEDGICLGCGKDITGLYSLSILKKEVYVKSVDRKYPAALIVLCYDCTLEQDTNKIHKNVQQFCLTMNSGEFEE